MDRRKFVSMLPGATLAGSLIATGTAQAKAEASSRTLPIFDPRQFGAKGDGRTLDTAAINSAIDACHRAGGGIVYLFGGNFLSGTVFLKSNVTFYIEAGAALLGSTNLADYSPQPGPPREGDAGQRHLIFARNANNVTLAGTGKIDGQGKSFWTHVPRLPVPENERWADALHFEWHSGPRVSPMIELLNCTDLRIEGVTITGSSGWTLRLVNCTRIFVSRIYIKNPTYGPNADGIDPTGCQDVLISDCIIEVGDDAICLKSENPYGDQPRLMRNVTVTNCVIRSATNAFKIGTATQGGFENITFSNSIIHNDDSALNERCIAGIALEMVDGGWLDGVVISGIEIQRARAPLFIRRGNRSRAGVNSQSRLRGITIDGLRASGAILTSSITGLPGMEAEDIRLSNIDIETVMPGKPAWVANPVPEAPKAYPQSRMFGWLPASGLYCRHVRGLYIRDVAFSAPASEFRTTVILDDVHTTLIDTLRSTPVQGGLPILTCKSVVDATVSATAAPPGAKALINIADKDCRNVLVTGCDLRAAEQVAIGNESTVQSAFNIEGKAESARRP